VVDDFIRAFLSSYFRTLFYFGCAIVASLMFAACVLVAVLIGILLFADLSEPPRQPQFEYQAELVPYDSDAFDN
jgi:hypothetical protein